MRQDAAAILEQLQVVAGERRRRTADPKLAQRVRAVKAYQHQRFARSYDDMLHSKRFSAAARFFLDDLYGPQDFEQRDAEFARVVPTLVKLFPQQIVATVQALATLHAISESLDTAMGVNSRTAVADPLSYAAAWKRTGRRDDRLRQIALVDQIGRSLDRYVRNPVLRHSLRIMRGPAELAGLASLQSFLEKGFDTFKELKGADDFLSLVGDRERIYIDDLFG